MQSEPKTCQNCKKEFVVEPEDFAFYEKMKVPAPTFCPECIYQRQIAFRNARNLYHRKDDLTGKDLISIYSPDKKFKIYDQKVWNGDDWDPMEYGRDYDFDRPFFEQLKELMHNVPWPSLNNWDGVNSDYCNFTKGNKNCYLVFGGDFNEDTTYSTFNFYTKNSSDLYWVNKSELCYEVTDSEKDYRSTHGRYLFNCVNTRFGFDLNGCQSCVGCVNLRNKSYYIFNEKSDAKGYSEFLQAHDTGSYREATTLLEKFNKLKVSSIHRPYKIVNSVGSTGDNLYNCKNCKFCFDIFDGAEDCKYIILAAGGLKDSYNCSHIGSQSELCYTVMSGYPCSRVVGSWIIIESHDIHHSMWIRTSNNCFGCVGLRNKKYCILNKQYSKEEYELLVKKIKKQMRDLPYINSIGQTYTYGDFFPPDLAPFGYNESVAYEQFPLTPKQAESQGYFWYTPEEKKYNITLAVNALPDNINEVTDKILQETIECAHNGICHDGCTTAFRLIASELAFYRQMNLPLPRLCSNCRNAARVHDRNPIKLWHRACMKPGCINEFETSYATERPEIVYCESCYQQEIL